MPLGSMREGGAEAVDDAITMEPWKLMECGQINLSKAKIAQGERVAGFPYLINPKALRRLRKWG